MLKFNALSNSANQCGSAACGIAAFAECMCGLSILYLYIIIIYYNI